MLRLRELMKQKDVIQKELAHKLRIQPASMSHIVTGKSMPSIKTLQEIAQALDVNIIELFKTGDDYSHFYDDETGEWLGVRKK